MIVIRVELHSAVSGKVTEIARAIIANKGGTRDGKLGDYDVATFRGRSAEQLNRLQMQRRGQVANHPRLAQHVWHLVAKALAAMGYGAPDQARQAGGRRGSPRRVGAVRGPCPAPLLEGDDR